MPTLETGALAPDFALTDQGGRQVKLSDYRGRKLLVYFYPKADTPGCTKQACSVRDHRAELSELALAVVGISPDQPKAQQAFDQKYGLGFPLLSDPEHVIASAYGVGKEGAGGINRSAFLIDEQGRVSQVWYAVKPEEMVSKARQALAG